MQDATICISFKFQDKMQIYIEDDMKSFSIKKTTKKKHSKPLLSQETVKKEEKKRKRAEYKRIETRKRKGSVK